MSIAEINKKSSTTDPIQKNFEWKPSLYLFIVVILIAGTGELLINLYPMYPLSIISYILFIVSYGLISIKIISQMIETAKEHDYFNENTLMIIATIGAIFTQSFLEAIAVMLFYRIGEMVEDYGVIRSQKSIRALIATRPEYAIVKSDDSWIKIKPEEVKIDDIIQVKPGERVPLDGILLSPRSDFNTAALTGESVPKSITSGNQALSGMINLSNLIEIQVTKTFENSTIARILNLVQNAEANKSPTEKFIRKFSHYYTPVVIIAALIIAIIPSLLFPQIDFEQWLYRACIFLVISCPCALVLSIPLTYFGGIGGASRNGILIKGSNHLDALAKLKTIVLDKTGTLTKGNFKVTDVITVDGVSAEQILESVARAEGNSTHPIAKSIQEAYGKSFDNETIESFQELPSYGIQATVQDQEVIAGNDKILHHFDVPHTYHFCDIEGTIVHVAMNRNYVGYIVISDEVKPDTAEAVKYLRDLGITEMMILSGDDACVVENLAQSLGIEHFHANLLPEDKVSEVESMHDSGNVVAFVGDGINDAPVIAQADIGIAMGALGSDAAIETADIVLMTDSLIRVGSAIQIARKTRSIIWQNLIVIFGIKILFLLLGAFGLMTMWGAVFADVGLSILAVLNARRIISYIPKRPNSK